MITGTPTTLSRKRSARESFVPPLLPLHPLGERRRHGGVDDFQLPNQLSLPLPLGRSESPNVEQRVHLVCYRLPTRTPRRERLLGPLLLLLHLLLLLLLPEQERLTEEVSSRRVVHAVCAITQKREAKRGTPEHGRTACSTTSGNSGSFRTSGRPPPSLAVFGSRRALCVPSGPTPQL